MIVTLGLSAVTFAARDADCVARFWATLLGREVLADDDGVLLPGDRAQVALRFSPTRAEKRAPNRVHLHLTSDASDLETVVAKAVGLEATHLDVDQLPDEMHVVLADPEGNELCVQSPFGGTKVAWGGPPVAPLEVPPRQWFELLIDDDPGAEIERLVAIGATRVSDSRGPGVVLADPDGNEFRLRA
ncbi:VOC family protein [Nocardioides ultimimeridianus]